MENDFQDRLRNSAWVRERLGGISYTTLWRLVRGGKLPRPVLLSGTPLYRESEIEAAVANLPVVGEDVPVGHSMGIGKAVQASRRKRSDLAANQHEPARCA